MVSVSISGQSYVFAPSTVAAIPVRYAAVDVLDPTRLTRLAT